LNAVARNTIEHSAAWPELMGTAVS
jgi:hypothetical protein